LCVKPALNVDACFCGGLKNTHTHTYIYIQYILAPRVGVRKSEGTIGGVGALAQGLLFVLRFAERLNAAARHIILSSAVRTNLQLLESLPFSHMCVPLSNCVGIRVCVEVLVVVECELYVLVTMLNGKLTT